MSPSAHRDRDESGRPRNSRPRDALGRPLPYGSEGMDRIPDDLQLSPTESLTSAQRLLDLGHAFSAHEVLEAAWKTGPPGERSLWQGLAQLAVGITHVQRGNLPGAAALWRRASERLSNVDLPAPYEVDVVELIRYADALAEDLIGGGDVEAARLRVQLVAPASR